MYKTGQNCIDTIKSCLLNLCGADNLAKYGMYVGNMKFDTQNAAWVSILITIRIILLMYFCVHHVQ